MSGFCGKGPFGETPPVSCRLKCIVNGTDAKECEWRGPATPTYNVVGIPNCIELNHSLENGIIYTRCRCGFAAKGVGASYIVSATAPSYAYSTEYPATATNNWSESKWSPVYKSADYSTSTSKGFIPYDYSVDYSVVPPPTEFVSKIDINADQNFKDIALKKVLEEHDEAIEKIKEKANKIKKKDRFELLDME